MAHLNWRNAALGQIMHPHPGRESRMELALSGDLLGALVPRLEEVLVSPGSGELRVDLPQEWIVFWKLREGDSRLLLAHPNPTEWVATMALERAHALAFVDRLKALASGQSVGVAEVAGGLAMVSSVSNVELAIQRTS